jgi:hypothetical protein
MPAFRQFSRIMVPKLSEDEIFDLSAVMNKLSRRPDKPTHHFTNIHTNFTNDIHTNFTRVYTSFYLSIHTVLLEYCAGIEWMCCCSARPLGQVGRDSI